MPINVSIDDPFGQPIFVNTVSTPKSGTHLRRARDNTPETAIRLVSMLDNGGARNNRYMNTN